MTGHSNERPAGENAGGTGRKPRRFDRLLLRFKRSQDGVAIVEFALIATPFFMLLAAILETALMFWTSQTLEEAVAQASRSLLTGQSQSLYKGSATANAAAFRDAICGRAPALIDCSKLTIDVRSYSSFSSAQTGTAGSNPTGGGTLNTSGWGYTQPQPGQIVVVRAVQEYSLLFTQWSSALANIGPGKRGIVGSTTFRTEPYTVS